MLDREFRTGQGAMFAATLAQLAEQLPGWRMPLPEPERRTIQNPFTGESIPNVLTKDPGPPTNPRKPRVLAFPCVLLPSREDWEQIYFALDLALSGEPALAQEAWDDGWLGAMQNRGLLEPPLFGGADNIHDPRELYEVPARVFERLLALPARDLDATAQDWQARCYQKADAPSDYLARFCALARAAASNGQRLFTWNIPPLDRERSGAFTSR